MLRVIGLGALVIAMALAFIKVRDQEFRDSITHPERAGVKVALADANKMVKEHGQVVEQYLAEETDHKSPSTKNPKVPGRFNLDRWWETRKPAMYEVAKAQNLREAALSIAGRKIPLHRQPRVAGNQAAPVTYFPAFEPILLVIPPDDRICTGSRPSECSDARGMYQEGYPAEHEHKYTVLQVPKYGGREGALPGNYHAMIARICNNGACTDWSQTGLVAAICQPGNFGGNVQLWRVGFGQIGNLRHVRDYVGATGYFSFDAAPHPQARAACAENPDVYVVPNLDLPSTPLDPGTIPVVVSAN